MSDYLVKCSCGKGTVVSEWAIGAPLQCRGCGKALVATEKNARLIEEPKRAPARAAETELPISPEGRLATRTKPSPSPYARDAASASRTADASAGNAPADPTAPSTPSASGCVRCGRAFRGDWDRVPRPEGVYCHVCANLVGVAPVESSGPVLDTKFEAAPLSAAFSPSPRQGVLDEPPPEVRPGPPPDIQKQIHRWVMLLAAIVIVLGLAVIYTDDTAVPPPQPTAEGEAPPPAPHWVVLAALAISFLGRFGVMGTALYFILHRRDRLPSDSALFNVLHLGFVTFLIQLLCSVIGVVPIVGWIMAAVITIYILWEVYDITFTDFFVLFVLQVMLAPLMKMVAALLVGVLGALFV